MIYQQQPKSTLQAEDELWRIIPRQSQDTEDTDIEFDEVELGNTVTGQPQPNEQDQEEPSSANGRKDLSDGFRRSACCAVCCTHQSALCGVFLVVLGAITTTMT